MSETLLSYLVAREKGLVFLSSPTRGGKTHLVKTVRSHRPNVIVTSGEWFVGALLQRLAAQGQTDLLDELLNYDCVCVEDIDWYGARPQTERELAREFTRLSERGLVIVTGIELTKRMAAMFQSLENYELFEKTEADSDWQQTV